MPETSLITESLSLMLIGLSVVFGFLLVLVFLLRLMALLVGKWQPDSLQPVMAAAPLAGSAADGAAGETEVIAVISAAVARYRSRPQR
jgi:oxaloacetate decarboxylase gamma subunit